MFNSYGQDSIKAMHRNVLTELNVNLFQGQLSLNNAINQIKFRYMLSDVYAIRLGITAESEQQTNNSDLNYGTNPSMDNETGKSYAIGINLGLEKHFKGTKRLSPYIGGEIAFGFRWSNYVINNEDLTTTISGAWQQTQNLQNVNGYYYTITTNSERGYFSIGLNLVTGFDFYVAKHLFIGYEFEFGFTEINYSNINYTYSGINSSNYSTQPTLSTQTFSFGPNLINGIRVGYVF